MYVNSLKIGLFYFFDVLEEQLATVSVMMSSGLLHCLLSFISGMKDLLLYLTVDGLIIVTASGR